MKPIRAFLPRADLAVIQVAGPSAMTCPFSTRSPWDDDRALVDAGALVGALELDDVVYGRVRSAVV